jgi:dihydroxyacetone kinase
MINNLGGVSVAEMAILTRELAIRRCCISVSTG